jgi:adenylylsulfate kinase
MTMNLKNWLDEMTNQYLRGTMIDSKKRTMAKAASWKVVGIVMLSVVTYLATGNLLATTLVALAYHTLQFFLFSLHDRLWNKVLWGKTKGLFIQMTGLSGAGKTTVARALEKRLKAKGFLVEIIDGDEYRTGLCKDLGFSKEDRNTNIRRLGFVGKVLARNRVVTVMSAINPYEAVRNELSEMGDFVKTVFVKCDLDTVIERDTKGLYKKALSGEIANFTGVSDPFEEPENPDLVLDTAKEAVEDSVSKLEKFILRSV